MTSTSAIRSITLALMLVAAPVVSVGLLTADQAQYFYDELGRLVGVVNGQGDAAVYNYDEVGNLLSIQRFTSSSGNVGIFLITPGSSVVSQPVQISGFGFVSPPGNNQVAFNGTTASVLSGTASSLIVTVPPGATTGLVTVTNANGTATSPQAFKVLVPPIITGVSPVKIPRGTVTRVLIGGFNLDAATSVQLATSGVTATIVSGGTSTVLPVDFAVTSGATTGSFPFTVTTPGGTAQSGLVTLAVMAAVPSFEVPGSVSVFLPPPAQLPPPPGTSMTVAPPVSVMLP